MNHEGIGLGLTIVKQIVHKHKGLIGVESDGPGQGSTFIITMKMQAVNRVCSNKDQTDSDPANTKLQFIQEEMKVE